MTSRFDNLPTEELVALEIQMRADRRDLMDLLRERFKAESGIEIGKVYRITEGRFEGRKILVEGVGVGGGGVFGNERPCHARVWGRLNGKSKAGDGWTIRRQDVEAKRLALIEEES